MRSNGEYFLGFFVVSFSMVFVFIIGTASLFYSGYIFQYGYNEFFAPITSVHLSLAQSVAVTCLFKICKGFSFAGKSEDSNDELGAFGKLFLANFVSPTMIWFVLWILANYI